MKSPVKITHNRIILLLVLDGFTPFPRLVTTSFELLLFLEANTDLTVSNSVHRACYLKCALKQVCTNSIIFFPLRDRYKQMNFVDTVAKGKPQCQR